MMKQSSNFICNSLCQLYFNLPVYSITISMIYILTYLTKYKYITAHDFFSRHEISPHPPPPKSKYENPSLIFRPARGPNVAAGLLCQFLFKKYHLNSISNTAHNQHIQTLQVAIHLDVSFCITVLSYPVYKHQMNLLIKG